MAEEKLSPSRKNLRLTLWQVGDTARLLKYFDLHVPGFSPQFFKQQQPQQQPHPSQTHTHILCSQRPEYYTDVSLHCLSTLPHWASMFHHKTSLGRRQDTSVQRALEMFLDPQA